MYVVQVYYDTPRSSLSRIERHSDRLHASPSIFLADWRTALLWSTICSTFNRINMRFSLSSSSATLLALLSCSTANGAPAKDVDILFAEQPKPDRWVSYDLGMPFEKSDTTNYTSSSIERRTDVTVCERPTTAPYSCVLLTDFLSPLVFALARIIKDASTRHDCDVTTGSHAGISWKYQANGGSHCDTTAQEKTIRHAIQHHLEDMDAKVLCAQECMKMDHGGKWKGWLLIGPSDGFNEDVYCGPELDFGRCSH
ncbi:hypothetical protein CLAFUW4_13366 [Fulvia fulva]|uniref:Secreted protein CSS2 C-terminal domain-containing protein n=1 Tax=Passalora fulva TaxID=5499 RepID=A0A9Q8PKD7_PASFU|nr:uncharacterized protein CLAFUR5_13219 [Fulvia fulva]KAK4611667.1 hypothetical protein CLAFUR4_13370 [Fulvia fulva]KAK4613008.1 hypothetical protein CLAFUR0_13376 [Fulvia fulva]UJO23989.1 hypothetical protein CLAFUR5_13219 [Fulvia fulva]WPV21358.1 hypothetical protein CLAFUW4_13366 [Fulvia fulva]WPV35901.1 hypothetical protein CLAFUW7_13373 [Fulvia fulva]